MLILKNRKVSAIFTTPKLLEALGEKVDLYASGIRGCFCGGTTMLPQYVRFIVEEVLENKILFQDIKDALEENLKDVEKNIIY